MNNRSVDKLEKELLRALSDQAKTESQIKTLTRKYRKAVFGPSYENPISVGDVCSFCGKPETQVKQLVAGANAFICNECIELSHEMIHEPKNQNDI